MEKTPIFLDTSALPRSPSRLSLGFESLAQLAQAGLVEVYISIIVKEEWKSQLESDWEQIIRTARDSLRALDRHPWSKRTDDFTDLLSSSSVLTIVPMQKYLLVDQAFEELLSELAATILPIKPGDADLVFSRYFLGAPPFGAKKNRNDIPDAFIFTSALELAGSDDNEIQCIISDNRLHDALSNYNNFILHNSIDEFIKTDLVKGLTRKLAPEKVWRAVYNSLVRSLPSQEKLYIEELNELLIDELSYAVITHSRIPEDNQEAYITIVNEVDEATFDWGAVIEYGPNLLALPFWAVLMVTLEFPVFRGEIYEVPDGVSIGGELNKQVLLQIMWKRYIS